MALAVFLIMAVVALMDLLLIIGSAKLEADDVTCNSCIYNDGREWDDEPCAYCTDENPKYERRRMDSDHYDTGSD